MRVGRTDGSTQDEFVTAGRKINDEVTLQDVATSAGNGVSVFMLLDTFKVTEISGTSTTRTVNFEISASENGTYTPVMGVRLSDLSMATQTTDSGDIWQIEGLSGLWFRVRVSTVSGGNVTVKGKAVA